MAVKTPEGLTQLQERFCQEFIKDCNATQAYHRARPGVTQANAESSSARLLSYASVKSRIAMLQQRTLEKSELSVQWVLDKLKMNAERALQIIPVLDKEGNETGKFQYEGSVANRACELIGKHLGMFLEKAEREGNAPRVTIINGVDVAVIIGDTLTPSLESRGSKTIIS